MENIRQRTGMPNSPGLSGTVSHRGVMIPRDMIHSNIKFDDVHHGNVRFTSCNHVCTPISYNIKNH